MHDLNNIKLSHYQENILYYITGAIAQKYLSNFSCDYCKKIVLTNKFSDHTYCTQEEESYSKFTSFVSRGGLCYPSKIVFEILTFTEKLYQLNITISHSYIKKRIINEVVKKFSSQLNKFVPRHPVTETDITQDLHEIKLVKHFSSVYCNLRIHTQNKKNSQNCTGRN